MAKTLPEWLKDKLEGMVSIQGCVVGREEADLIAFAWSGKQLRVHLITEPVRTRWLRRTLQRASEIGVNTLFIVDGRLFPEDGAHLEPKEWMLALHELTYERIYTYQIRGRRAALRPLHLEAIPGTGEQKMWYGPAVDFETIQFYRRTVTIPRSLRGDWLAADFGNKAYWRNTDYRSYQYKTSQRERAERHAYQETWSSGETANGSSDTAFQRIRRPLQSQLDACYEILGIDKDATEEEAKRAFRKRAIAVHPDTSNLPVEQAAKQFQILSEAYEYLRAAKGWT